MIKKKWTPDQIDDLCEAVYKIRLEEDCRGNVQRMLDRDKDDGQKLRGRARGYRPAVMATLKALDLVDEAPAKKRDPSLHDPTKPYDPNLNPG